MNTAKQMMPQGMTSMPGTMNAMMTAIMNSMMGPMMGMMSCKMENKSMMCEIKPMGGMSMKMMEACCDMINKMCDMGAMMTVQCCNMSMMVKMECMMKKDSMTCTMMPMEGMSMEMMECCCQCMMTLSSMGMPMSLMCGNTTLMVCCTK